MNNLLYQSRVPVAHPDELSSQPLLRTYLRGATRTDHCKLDAAYSAFDLSDRHGYTAFLSAHARAVPALELALEDAGVQRLLPDWQTRHRRHSLFDDMTQLCATMPPTLQAPDLSTVGALWGAVYVLEGSKLGGTFLLKSVPSGLPTAFLAPRGAKGDTKRFMDRLDEIELDNMNDARDAALAVFALFSQAACLEKELPVP